MLAYAFSVSTNRNRFVCGGRQRDRAGAAILERGVSLQLKRASGRVRESDRGALTPAGKSSHQILEIMTILRRQLVCSYDEFSVDTTMDRI